MLSTEGPESSATQAEEQSDGSDLVLHSLRQQQEIVAGEEMKGNEDSGQASATKTVLASPQDDKVEAAQEEQAALPAEVVGDDEAWDTSLEATGPVEEWA